MDELSKSVAHAAETTAELAKSVGRFSLALSVLAAKQVSALVSPPKSEAPGASVNEVSRAAGSQLSGVVRTAYSVGMNVQSGLVDAAFDLAGLGVSGAAPEGDTSGLAVPLTDRVARGVAGLRTVAAGALNRPVPQPELVERLNRYHLEASAPPMDIDKALAGLWKSEGLAASVGRYLLAENSLHDPALLPAVLPMAHVGFGAGTAEALRFDPATITARIDAACDPRHRGFAYEGIGAAIRLYEPGLFKVMSGALGVIPLDAPDGPDPAGFFASTLARYDAEAQRLIAHGYGRFVALSSIDINAAIAKVTTFPVERIAPAAQGCGFSFALMNSAELPRLLEHSAIPFEPVVQSAFQDGLVYGLVFLDWYVPGLLADWRATGAHEAELVEHARHEAEASRLREYLLPFRVERPRG